MCAASANNPSETSIAADATARNDSPSDSLAMGRANRPTKALETIASLIDRSPRSAARPAAASPRVPLTQTRSPSRAPLRFRYAAVGVEPMTVTVTDKGPRVVSPPTRGKPVCSLASFSPSTKAVNQPSSTQGIVSANSIPVGAAPIAAKSLAAAITLRKAISAEGMPGRKWTPSTAVSTEV